MGDVERLLSEFVDAWNAGERPSARAFLDRVPDVSARSMLAEEISGLLDVAPTPEYSPARTAELRDEPVVRAAAIAFERGGSAWPALLPRWRAAAGLTFEQFVDLVLAAAGLAGGDHGKAASYVAAMERGELDAARVSQRAIDALSRVLGVDHGDFARLGRPALSGGAALFRAGSHDTNAAGAQLEALADAMLTPVDNADRDAVDDFFLG